MARKSKSAGARTGFGALGAKANYETLSSDRQSYTDRAEKNAAVTIPALFPKASDGSSTKYTQPYQSMGARGVNNLAAKLMLALFPQQTWMKLEMSEWLMKQVVNDPALREKASQSLGMVERILMKFMESNAYSSTLFEVIKQLVVSGNCLIVLPEPKENYAPMKVYRLNSYVVQRDAVGNLLQLVTVDKLAFSSLPEDVKNTLANAGDRKPDEEVEIYTHLYLDETGKNFLAYEEIDSVEIAGTAATYPIEACPYIPVRMIRQDNESYGRSYVEDYLGDLTSLENLTESIVNMSMIASKVVGLVNPSGLTQPRRLVNAQTGDFVPGRLEDVSFLQLGKMNDFNVAQQTAVNIESRLSYAFLLNSAVQRNAERVTATEIRLVAQELQDTLGGVYSVLSQELQLRLIKVLLNQLQATKKIPELPQEAIEPTIVVGMEALGRGQDKDKLMEFMQGMAMMANLAQNPNINLDTFALRYANAVGIDVEGILLSEEEKAQMRAEAAMSQGTMAGAQALGQGAGMQATASPEAMAQAADNVGLQPQPVF